MKVKDVFEGCLLSIVYLIIGLTIPVLIFLFFNYTTYWWYLFLKDTPKEQVEVIDKFTSVIFPCIALAFPVTLILLYRKTKKRREEIIRISDENNTFITARLVEKVRVIHNRKGPQWDYSCTYEYILNGKIKKHHVGVLGQPLEERRLYRKRKNSNKVFSTAASDQITFWAIPLGCLATILVFAWTCVMNNIVSDFLV